MGRAEVRPEILSCAFVGARDARARAAGSAGRGSVRNAGRRAAGGLGCRAVRRAVGRLRVKEEQEVRQQQR